MRAGSRTSPDVRRRIFELYDAGLNAAQIAKKLVDVEIHERTVRRILKQQVGPPQGSLGAGGATAWSFFDDDMAPEDARLVLDYYATLPDAGRANQPRPILKPVARIYVRVRRALPELSPAVAMGFARMSYRSDDPYGFNITWALIGEARNALEER